MAIKDQDRIGCDTMVFMAKLQAFSMNEFGERFAGLQTGVRQGLTNPNQREAPMATRIENERRHQLRRFAD
jgi:hypothetical protein